MGDMGMDMGNMLKHECIGYQAGNINAPHS